MTDRGPNLCVPYINTNKKILNVVEILSNIYSTDPGSERSNEAANVFCSDKATLQMEMILIIC